MSSDIQTSKNVFFHWNTATTPGMYTQPANITFVPDVCVVREVSYCDTTPTAGTGLYFIWSNLKNDYIASFSVTQNSYNTYSSVQLGQSTFVSNPQTVLTQVLNAPSQIGFRIDALVAGVLVPQTTLAGSVSLQLDFIKYKESR